jgi:hypothetical protein
MRSDETPLNETPRRFSTCTADASPYGPICEGPTTALLTLTCVGRHYRLTSVCDEHAAVAQQLPSREPCRHACCAKT